MAQNQLPAHLQNRKRVQKLSEIATAGIGGGLPPHISIQGNEFTLIDAAGNEQSAEGSTIQAVIVDVSSVMCKMYYGKEYQPGANEPPICWSTNGLAPSRDAVSPQNIDCASCVHNERGSAISKISGASIKACRDEKHLAIYLPKHPNMLFRLVVTPGSFKNWSAFTKPFANEDVDICDVLVQIGFQPKTNGVLTFQATQYIDADTAAVCDKALAEKATDALVGRNDVPWPGYQKAISAGHTVEVPQAPVAIAAHSDPVPSAAFAPGSPFTAPSPAPAPFAAGATAPAAFPSPEPQKRHRRTKAEIEAAKAQEGGNGQTQEPQRAPFRLGPPPGGASFGIGPGTAPNPEVQQMLGGIFKK